jgi:Spy/CpxP family protein refolding chaperone
MKRTFVAALLGSILGITALAASAQPMQSGTALEMLRPMKGQLNLNTSQQQQWDNAVALSEAAHSAMHASFQQGRAALQAELAKPEPDFAALAAAADGARDEIASAHRQARDAWLALYATFTPEQKGVARDAIKAKIQEHQTRRAAHSRRSTAS